MRTYRIGERVRIVRATHPEHVGKEATVVSALAPHPDHGAYLVHDLLVDNMPSKHPTREWLAQPDQLEPLSDSNQLVTWESMRELWMPDEVRA